VNREDFLPDGPLVRSIVGIGMADTVRANSLHDANIVAPVHRPVAHMVLRWVVDDAVFSGALVWGMGSQGDVLHVGVG
jgi:hypothetical protein